MRKLYTLFLFVIAVSSVSAQQILLMTETFDNGPANLFFDSSAGLQRILPGVPLNSGNNNWVVNDSFAGLSVYPNTPPEDSVVSGQINPGSAPYSNYLHIHDVAAVAGGGPANDNWNPASPSDRFVYMGNSFCTLGLDSVIFTFFWISEGDSNAYGQVYYRDGAGPWIRTGQLKYYNQPKWKYEILQDPAFNNLANLQFGFRWVNAASSTRDVSFGIDDIIAVGNYDSINHPVKMNISLLTTTICQGDPIYFNFTLSEPLCYGNYDMQLSDANGSFANPNYLGTYTFGSTFTTGTLGTLGTPGTLLGNCFKFRIVRSAPQPKIISDTVFCIDIVFCPNLIFNLVAPVMNDVDTTCILSEIDIKFNSTGVFHNGNTYIAELSDSTGSFADSSFLGQLQVRDSFPSMPPGSISGLIPATVPPGCGYYIRVRSTHPVAYSALLGPYCLTQCDVLTNNHTDLHNCVQSGPYPLCDTIVIHPHQWNNNAAYDTCNNWTVELRSMKDFSLVNSGGLAVYHDSIGGRFILCMPPTAAQLPVAPGAYYMRIVSNCSNLAWNQTGSVIRITIGAPNANPPLLFLNDSVFCPGDVIDVTVAPFNHPPSDYQWTSNLLNNGNAFIWPYDPLGVSLSPGTPIGTYRFYVQEINYGCYGPSSAPAIVSVIGKPNVHITGPPVVCLGDTVIFNVTYITKTYYHWTAPPGVQVLIQGNSQVYMIFNNLGTYHISLFSLNHCGSDSGTFTVKVISPYSVTLGPDTTVCLGQPLVLTAQTTTGEKVFTTFDTTRLSLGQQGAMFNIIAHYDVTIDSFAVEYLTTHASVKAEIYGKPGTYFGFEQNQGAWSFLTSYYNFPSNPVGQMTVIPAEVNQAIAHGDTFAFYVTTVNTGPIVKQAYSAALGFQQGTVYKTDGVIDFVQGAVLPYPYGNPLGPEVLNARIYYTTKAGLKYIWNTGDTTPVINTTPKQNSRYYVLVYDSLGCRNQDTINVAVVPSPKVEAGPDTVLCKGVSYVMSATDSGAAGVMWSPGSGLSDSTILNPVFSYNQSVSYILTATAGNGCKTSDTVVMNVSAPTVYPGHDTSFCPGETYVIPANSSTQNIYWSPGFGLSDSTSINPTFNLTESMTYVLTATDSNGCKVSGSVKITIIECADLSVPNAFTPNGDGKNDFFTVFGHVADYEIRIFNRWGQEVYSSSDVNELNQADRGWDGTFKGKLQDSGTFVYYITAKDFNGKNITRKGNLTLIR